MRIRLGLAAGLAFLGIAGCSAGNATGSPASGPTPTGSRNVTTAPPVAPASRQAKASARAAAVRFYQLYSAGHFAAAWDQLSATTKSEIQKHAWVSVHEGCASGGEKSRVVRSVTVFGNAAIVTEVLAGGSAHVQTTEDVFNFANGRWRYSPANPSIYRHRSVAADIAAARSAGTCASWKIF